MLAAYIRQDPLLSTFFDPFIFEDVPANTQIPSKVYLEKVRDSAVYIGLLGEQYGHEDAEGMFLVGAIERYGTGTLDIFTLTKDKGLKDPVITIREGFKFTIWRPVANADQVTDHDAIHDIIHDTTHDAANTTIAFKEIPDLTRRLVLVIRGEMTHPDKPQSKSQKYRLTRKGRALQKRLLNE